MEPTTNSNKNKIIIGVGILVLIVIAIVAFRGKFDNDADENTTSAPVETINTASTTNTVASSTVATASTTPVVGKLEYKDGTYTANGKYMSPGGPDEIAVILTIKNDIVTDADVKTVVADKTSQKYQDKFISGYKQVVIGKKLSDLKLTKVSGASLTPEGFNDALTKIKAQAKA